jgi:hypothetical protein
MHRTEGRKSTSLSVALFAAMLASFAGTTRADVVVMPAEVGISWSTNDTRSGGSVSFVPGPATPPLGTGSLQLATTDAFGTSQAKAQLFNYSYIGTQLIDIDAISYATYRSSSSTNSAAQTIGLNIEVDFVGDGSSFTTLVFEPVYQAGGVGAMQLDAWQLWDAFNSGNAIWWSTKDIPGVCAFNCFVPWGTIVTNNPSAKVKFGFGFNVGSGWAGQFTGATDGLTIGVLGSSTTYDFEPEPLCTNTCYVDATTGDNSFGGASPGRAKKTIQAGVNAVDPNGTVIVAPGTYAENVDVNKMLSIVGSGSGTNPLVDTIIDPTGGSYGLYIHQPVGLADLRVTGAPSHGIRVEKLTVGRLAFTAVTWDNIASSANGGEGAEIHNGTDVSDMAILNSEFAQNNAQGIRTASDVTIDGMDITDSTFDQNSYGLYLQGTIDDLVISGSSLNSNDAWGLYMSETGPITNVHIEGSSFMGNTGWGIVLYTAASIDNVTITRNEIDNGGQGLWVGADGPVTSVYGTCNWWGDASGPSGAGPGSGDAVNETVTFAPWLLTDDLNGPCVGGTPLGIKQTVLLEMQNTTPGTQEKKKFDPALKALKESLAMSLWVDPSHIVPPSAGETVFNKEKTAVTKLRELRNMTNNVTPDDDTALGWILSLVQADRLLATTAIEDKTPGGKADKLQRANDELAKGDVDRNNGSWDKAIDHYKNAWKYAQQA